MKHLLALLLSAALLLSSGCGPGQEEPSSSVPPAPSQSGSASTAPPEELPYTLTARTPGAALSAAGLLADLGDFRLVQGHEGLTAHSLSDLELVSPGVAARLYAQSEGGVRLLAITDLGSLSLVSKGAGISSLKDLRGRTLFLTDRGADVEYVLRHLLVLSGLDPDRNVTLEWLDSETDVISRMKETDEGVCLLSGPGTARLLQGDKAAQAGPDLAVLWEEAGLGTLVTGCAIAPARFVEEQPQLVQEILTGLEASAALMSDPDRPEDAAAAAVQTGLAAEDEAPGAAAACGARFIIGEEMKNLAEEYYLSLFQAGGDSIGGSLPFDSFYFGVK